MMRKKDKKYYDKINKLNLQWYVLYHDFNTDEIKPYNIFNSTNFIEGIARLFADNTPIEDFATKVRDVAIYSFMSKVEYEILVQGVVSHNEKQTKLSIYEQLKNNITQLTDYILRNMVNKENMLIKVVDKSDKDNYGIIKLDKFMFGDFEINFKDGSQLPRNDLMYYRDDYSYYIRLSDDDKWYKIKLQKFY